MGAAARPRWLVLVLVGVVFAGCAGPSDPSPPPLSPTPAGNPAPSASTPPGAPTPPETPTPSTRGTPALDPIAGPIAGIWRVRKVLSADHRSTLIPGAAYDDEAFVVKARCDAEPCPSLEVTMTPLGEAAPVSVATLERDGDTYVSAATAENDGPCLNDQGDRVPGGATVTSTLRLWLSSDRPAGSATESTLMVGTIDLRLRPTPIGTASGCADQTAAYELTGRREAVAIRTRPTSPGNGGGSAGKGPSTRLPPIAIKVSGATITYFPIEGDTARELISSLGRGGLKACGAINYEWHRGDDRPVACAVTRFVDLDDSIGQKINRSTGTCTIARASVKARYTIHFPRWTEPKRVPTRLLEWWRRIVTFIRDHEAGHTRITRDHVKKLNAQLLGADCSTVNSIIKRWASRINRANEDYDRREYAKPWPVPPPGY